MLDSNICLGKGKKNKYCVRDDSQVLMETNSFLEASCLITNMREAKRIKPKDQVKLS